MTPEQKIQAMLDETAKEVRRLNGSAYSMAIGASMGELLKKLRKIAAEPADTTDTTP